MLHLCDKTGVRKPFFHSLELFRMNMSHKSGRKWFRLDRRETCCQKEDDQRFLSSLVNRLECFPFFTIQYISINPVKLLKSAQFLLWHTYIWTTTICFPNDFTTDWTKSIFFHRTFPQSSKSLFSLKETRMFLRNTWEPSGPPHPGGPWRPVLPFAFPITFIHTHYEQL